MAKVDYEVGREFSKETATSDREILKTRFKNCLNSVNNALLNNSIYNVWIRFEIGTIDPIIINTASNNPDKNIVATLNYTKSGAGAANEFKLKLKIDPFNNGQDPTPKDTIYKLDNMMAKKIVDYVGSGKQFKEDFGCTFQYGYDIIGSSSIVSPKYSGLILKILPNVKYASGIIEYDIEGTSTIIVHGGTEASIPASKVKNPGSENPQYQEENVVVSVTRILWEYYGNASIIPDVIKDKTYETGKQFTDANYTIVIDPDLMANAPNEVHENFDNMTPFNACQVILRNKHDIRDTNGTGRYVIQILDTDSGDSTIQLSYQFADSTAIDKKEIIDFSFTWNTQSKSIVTNWSPKLNTFLYLQQVYSSSRKANEDVEAKKAQDVLAEVTNTFKKNVSSGIGNAALLALEVAKTGAAAVASSGIASAVYENELKDAEIQQIGDDVIRNTLEPAEGNIQLVGIPADIPMGVYLNIKPILLESVSRSKGLYIIQSSSDTISTSGRYVTDISVFRIGDLQE